jgi:hypothetical protein
MKLQGDQLQLTMPIADRPRDQWQDMNCPLLSGLRKGDRLCWRKHVGTVTITPDAEGNCTAIADFGSFKSYLNRRLVADTRKG